MITSCILLTSRGGLRSASLAERHRQADVALVRTQIQMSEEY
jgi:hypothetical protein